jgi:hypothetical protein
MVDETANYLARVSDLHITTAYNVRGLELEPSDVARVLRTAPQLKTFHIARFVHGDAPSWLAPAALTHPALEGLVHPRLREFAVSRGGAQGAPQSTPLSVEWVAHLRQRYFPRLRALVIWHNAYYTT